MTEETMTKTCKSHQKDDSEASIINQNSTIDGHAAEDGSNDLGSNIERRKEGQLESKNMGGSAGEDLSISTSAADTQLSSIGTSKDPKFFSIAHPTTRYLRSRSQPRSNQVKQERPQTSQTPQSPQALSLHSPENPRVLRSQTVLERQSAKQDSEEDNESSSILFLAPEEKAISIPSKNADSSPALLIPLSSERYETEVNFLDPLPQHKRRSTQPPPAMLSETNELKQVMNISVHNDAIRVGVGEIHHELQNVQYCNSEETQRQDNRPARSKRASQKSSLWQEMVMIYRGIRTTVMMFKNPLTFLLACLLWAIIAMGGLAVVGIIVCQSQYINSWATICHTTTQNPVCSFPYAQNIIVWCPHPRSNAFSFKKLNDQKLLNLTECLEIPHLYAGLVNTSEEALLLPYAFSNIRMDMAQFATEIEYSGFESAANLSAMVRKFDKEGMKASSQLGKFTRRTRLSVVDVYYVTEALIKALQKRVIWSPYRRLIQEPVKRLFGFSTEPTVDDYKGVWISYFSELQEELGELRQDAANLSTIFENLASDLIEIHRVSTEELRAKEEQFATTSPPLLSFTWFFQSRAAWDYSEIKRKLLLLKDFESARFTSANIVRSVLLGLDEISDSMETLRTELQSPHSPKRANVSLMRQIGVLRVAVEELAAARAAADKRREEFQAQLTENVEASREERRKRN